MSTFVVSARKYRPARFHEVIGQEQVSQTLKRALQQDRVAQSFLFCGPHGVGKTTCARILAKALNCTNRSEDFEPCGTCGSCESFNKNASFNILELDAASNNSVDHMRQLTEQVRFAPQEGRYKVFIIDEVHMLSSSAFNAFLKTLEEPPSYAIFILATTEKHKILPTILSRCQIFEFNRISTSDIVGHLLGIADQEQVKISEEALHTIAKKANGAMRDALSLYDKIISSVGSQVERSDVVKHLSLLDEEAYFEIVEHMLTENMPGVMLSFDEIIREGFQPEIFVQGLSDHFRNLLMSQNEATVRLLDVPESVQDKYLQQGQLASSSFSLSGLDLLNQCDLALPRSSNKRLQVELCLAKITYLLRALKRDVFAPDDKKKLEAAVNPVSPPKPEVTQAPSQPSHVPPASVSEHSRTDESSPSSSATMTSASSSSSATRPLRSSAKKKLVSLGDFDNIEAEIREQLEQKDEVRELDLESLTAHWLSYAEEKLDAAASKAAFRNAELELEENRLSVRVANRLQKYNIVDEKDLLEYLWAKAKNRSLEIDVMIDPDMAQEPQDVKMPLTNKDIYDEMVQINPLLPKFLKELGLSEDKDI